MVRARRLSSSTYLRGRAGRAGCGRRRADSRAGPAVTEAGERGSRGAATDRASEVYVCGAALLKYWVSLLNVIIVWLTLHLFLIWHLILTFLLTSFHVNPGGSDTLAMAWWQIYTVGSKQIEMKW